MHGHAWLFVNVFNDDIVRKANMGRQLFTHDEVGLSNAVTLINRLKRFFGSNWKAHCRKVSDKSGMQDCKANIIISCADTVKTRFDIAGILKKFQTKNYGRDSPLYWMDFGNSQYSGQVILSTIGKIKQPPSNTYETVSQLPQITK